MTVINLPSTIVLYQQHFTLEKNLLKLTNSLTSLVLSRRSFLKHENPDVLNDLLGNTTSIISTELNLLHEHTNKDLTDLRKKISDELKILEAIEMVLKSCIFHQKYDYVSAINNANKAVQKIKTLSEIPAEQNIISPLLCATLYNFCGMVLRREDTEKGHENAENCFKYALESLTIQYGAPYRAMVLVNMAFAELTDGKLDTAIKHCHEAEKLIPGSAPNYVDVGNCKAWYHFLKNEHETAYTEYKQIIDTINSNNCAVLFENIAVVLLDANSLGLSFIVKTAPEVEKMVIENGDLSPVYTVLNEQFLSPYVRLALQYSLRALKSIYEQNLLSKNLDATCVDSYCCIGIACQHAGFFDLAETYLNKGKNGVIAGCEKYKRIDALLAGVRQEGNIRPDMIEYHLPTGCTPVQIIRDKNNLPPTWTWTIRGGKWNPEIIDDYVSLLNTQETKSAIVTDSSRIPISPPVVLSTSGGDSFDKNETRSDVRTEP